MDKVPTQRKMQSEVRKASSFNEVETPEHCYILEVANDPGDEFVSIARARVKAGITTALHRVRGTAERYVIVAGVGRVEVTGLDLVEVAAGDVVRIPPDTPQRITNIGTTDLIFYCVCTPRFDPQCYELLE